MSDLDKRLDEPFSTKETTDFLGRRALVIDDGLGDTYEVPHDEVGFFIELIEAAYRKGKKDMKDRVN